MHTRAKELIERLSLVTHPEGGWYREVWRSPSVVTASGRPGRAASTSIYFLLTAGERSRWHRVASDEIWHWYEGDDLELHSLSHLSAAPRTTILGRVAAGRAPVAVVPAGDWQAARSRGDYTLVGCSVAPGFDFADFRLLADDPAAAARLRARLPDHAAFL